MNISANDFNTSRFDNHHMFTIGDSMRQISSDFLQTHNLSHFSYIRVYDDNTTFSLSTHSQITKEYFERKFYTRTKYDKPKKDFSSAALLWLGFEGADSELIEYVKEYYNVGNGLVLMKRQAGFMEQIYFASTPDNIGVNNYYLANLDEFHNFAYYFKEQAKQIILTADKNRFTLDNYKTPEDISDRYNYPEYNAPITIEKPLFKKLYYDPKLKKLTQLSGIPVSFSIDKKLTDKRNCQET